MGRLSRSLARLLLDNGRIEEAVVIMEHTVGETTSFLERIPTDNRLTQISIKGSLEMTYELLADGLRDQGDFAGAGVYEEKAREIHRAMGSRRPSFPSGGNR
jgi:hypothetical protein